MVRIEIQKEDLTGMIQQGVDDCKEAGDEFRNWLEFINQEAVLGVPWMREVNR